MIAAYLKRLEDALADDPALAAQVLQEVRDHLEEALAADASGDRCAAERRVIERFGDPCELAGQFAPVSLAQHTRRAGMAIMFATGMIMIMMKARVLWYGVVEWKLSEPVQALASRIIMVDRYAFWLAAGGAVASALYIARQPVPACLNAHYQKHVQRAAGLFILAAIPLGISVTSDLALTILQLPTDLSPAALIPVISISVEIGCIIAAALMVGNAARRAARVQANAPPSG